MKTFGGALAVILTLCGLVIAQPLPSFATAITDTAWARLYTGPGNAADIPVALKLDASGDVIVTGSSPGTGTGRDYATLKYDPDGVLLWEKRYDGSGSDADTACALWVDETGNIYVTGGSVGAGSSYDYATLKYAPDGTLLWERRYNGPANLEDRAYGLFVDATGNVYVTGHSWGLGTGPDYATIKYDAAGTQLWVKRYNRTVNGSDSARVVQVDASGNVYVTGTSFDPTTSFDIVTLKYNAAGTLQWTRVYQGNGGVQDRPFDMTLDEAANVYVTGAAWTGGTRDDYVTLKYDTDGNLLWDRLYDGTGHWYDAALVVKVDPAHNVYITGGSDGPSPFASDIATVKYDANGTFLWDRRYDGPIGGGDAIGYGLYVNSAGDVYVGGFSDSVLTDYTILRYAADGTPKEARRYNVSNYTEDLAYALAVDGDGYMYLTGTSNPAGQPDYSTVKFVPCICSFQGDSDEDGFVTAIDLGRIVDILFVGAYNLSDQGCPSYRFDLDCDGFVTALDLTRMIDYLFASGVAPCDPCVTGF